MSLFFSSSEYLRRIAGMYCDCEGVTTRGALVVPGFDEGVRLRGCGFARACAGVDGAVVERVAFGAGSVAARRFRGARAGNGGALLDDGGCAAPGKRGGDLGLPRPERMPS